MGKNWCGHDIEQETGIPRVCRIGGSIRRDRELAARRHATRDFIGGVLVDDKVYEGQKLTRVQARKLTGIPAPMCLDFLMETELDHPTVVLMPKKLKPQPTKLDVVTTKRQQAESRVDTIQRKITRLEKLLKKWQKKVGYCQRRADNLAATDTDSVTSETV